MTFTQEEVRAFGLVGEDTYLIHLDSLVACTVCARPVISLPLNGNATKHSNCK